MFGNKAIEKKELEIKTQCYESECHYEDYLSNLKIEEIEDEESREEVKYILSMEISERLKAQEIEKYLVRKDINNLLKRTEDTGGYSENISFKMLKKYQKIGIELTPEDIKAAKLLLKELEEVLGKAS